MHTQYAEAIPPDIRAQYQEGWLDFKGLVGKLFDIGYSPREAYAIAREAEEKYMQALARKGWERQDAH